MKELIKNNFRTLIRKYRARTLYLMLMVFLTTFLMSIFINLWGTYSKGISEYKTSLNLETASFMLDSKNDNADSIEDISQKYDIHIQKEEYKVLQTEGNTYKVFTNENKDINKFRIIEGRNSKSNNEILVDKNYFSINNLELGKSLMIGVKSYTIVGTFIKPNQVFPTIDNNKFYNGKGQGLILLNSNEFHSLTSDKINYYSTNADKTKLELFINNEKLQYIMKSEDNPEIAPLFSKFQMVKIIAGLSGNILVVVVLIILIMALVQNINDDKKIIGILKAEGYKDGKILLSYFQYPLISIFAALLGGVVGGLFTSKMLNLMNDGILLDIKFSYIDGIFNTLIIAAALGFLMWITSILTTTMLINKSPLFLIRGTLVQSVSKFRRKIDKIYCSKSIESVLKMKLITRRISIVFLIVFAGYALSAQFIFGGAMYQLSDNIGKESIKGINYKANVILKKPLSEALEEGISYGKNEIKYNNGQYSLISLDSKKDNAEAIDFYNEDSKTNISEGLKDGIIINRLMSLQSNLKIGDEIIVKDMAGKDVKLKVSGISQFIQSNEIYTSTRYLTKFNDFDVSFKGIYTKDSQRYINDINVSRIIDVSDISNNLNETKNKFKIVGLIQFGVGIILGCAILIVALNISIFQNKKEVSLLFSMGYSFKSVKRITIYSYGYLLIVGLIVGSVYVTPLLKILFKIFSKGVT